MRLSRFAPAFCPTFIPFELTDTQTKTKHKTLEVKRILLRAQTVMSKSPKGHNPGAGTWGPRDEAQNSAEDGKQIRSLGPKLNQHGGDYKVEEAFDKCLLNGPLKMDLCQLCAATGQLPVTSHNNCVLNCILRQCWFFKPPSFSAPSFFKNCKQKDGKDDILWHINQRHANVLMPDQKCLTSEVTNAITPPRHQYGLCWGLRSVHSSTLTL